MIERDGFFVHPKLGVTYGNRSASLNPAERQILFTLASTSEVVSPDAMTMRVPSAMKSKIGNFVSSAKLTLKRAGIPWPIIFISGEGYRWVGVERAAQGPVIKGWFGSQAHAQAIAKRA